MAADETSAEMGMKARRNSFTNQLPRIATEADCGASWGGEPGGKRFRCYLCGHKFIPGDTWRWVYGGSMGLTNFLVCRSCDGPFVLDQWVDVNKEAQERFWWLL